MRVTIWDAKIAEVYYARRDGRPEAIRLLVDDNRDNRAVIWLNPGLASAVYSASLEAIEGLAACELSKLGCIAPDIMEETS